MIWILLRRNLLSHAREWTLISKLLQRINQNQFCLSVLTCTRYLLNWGYGLLVHMNSNQIESDTSRWSCSCEPVRWKLEWESLRYSVLAMSGLATPPPRKITFQRLSTFFLCSNLIAATTIFTVDIHVCQCASEDGSSHNKAPAGEAAHWPCTSDARTTILERL